MTNVTNWLLFGKLFNKMHCEKIKYITVVGIVSILYISYMIYTNKWNEPIEYLYLALLAGIGGYLGVIYYKVMNKKPLNFKTTLLFFLDK
jgi:hypothetical protein